MLEEGFGSYLFAKLFAFLENEKLPICLQALVRLSAENISGFRFYFFLYVSAVFFLQIFTIFQYPRLVHSI